MGLHALTACAECARWIAIDLPGRIPIFDVEDDLRCCATAILLAEAIDRDALACIRRLRHGPARVVVWAHTDDGGEASALDAGASVVWRLPMAAGLALRRLNAFERLLPRRGPATTSALGANDRLVIGEMRFLLGPQQAALVRLLLGARDRFLPLSAIVSALDLSPDARGSDAVRQLVHRVREILGAEAWHLATRWGFGFGWLDRKE